jgi:hypothetical protein
VRRWRKGTAGVAGALVGGVAGFAIVWIVWLTLYNSPANNWDWVTPLFVLLLAVGAAVLSAAAGGFAAARMASGRPAGMGVLAATLAACAALPVLFYVSWVIVMPRIPNRTRPATSGQRADWFDHFRAQPAAGFQLAHRVQDCASRYTMQLGPDHLAAGECAALAETRADQPHDNKYKDNDLGWRWHWSRMPNGYRVTIFLDPVLQERGHAAPVFEVWRPSGLLVTRERHDAPAFIARSDLPALQAFRECLLDAAPRLRASGAWDGDPMTLVHTLGRNGGCPRVPFTADDPNALRRQNVDLEVQRDGRVDPVHLSYRPSTHADGGFDLLLRADVGAYLLDRDGQWHVTRRMNEAQVSDPPPVNCELDPAVPCNPPLAADDHRRGAAITATDEVRVGNG